MASFLRHQAKALAVFSFMLCFAAMAQAHKVNIFAALDGNMIVGKVYFTGGGVAENVDVDVCGPDGLKIATAQTNAKGEFFFVPKSKDTQYLFTVDTGDGHAAKTTVAVGSSVTLPAPKPPKPPVQIAIPSLPQMTLQKSQVDGTNTQFIGGASSQQSSLAIDPDLIASVVSMELSKQMLPLCERIDKQQSRIRLTDVLGGLGYIVGIFGILAFLRARKLLEQAGAKPKDEEKRDKERRKDDERNEERGERRDKRGWRR